MGAPSIDIVIEVQWKKSPRKPRGGFDSKLKFPSMGDLEIYQRHLAGESGKTLAVKFKISEIRVWGICWKIKKEFVSSNSE